MAVRSLQNEVVFNFKVIFVLEVSFTFEVFFIFEVVVIFEVVLIFEAVYIFQVVFLFFWLCVMYQLAWPQLNLYFASVRLMPDSTPIVIACAIIILL